MFLSTSADGLYHNMKDWNFEHCGDFKLMEQDYDAAIKAIKLYGSSELFYKLENWDFSCGSFKIPEEDYEETLKCIQILIEETNKKRGL